MSNEDCEYFKKYILDFAKNNYPDIVEKLQIAKEFTDSDKKKLNECIVAFFRKKEKGSGLTG